MKESPQNDEEPIPASPLRPITEEPSFDDDQQNWKTNQKSKSGILKKAMQASHFEALQGQSPIQVCTPDFKLKLMSGIKPLALSTLMTTHQMMMSPSKPGSSDPKNSTREKNNNNAESHNQNIILTPAKEAVSDFSKNLMRDNYLKPIRKVSTRDYPEGQYSDPSD